MHTYMRSIGFSNKEGQADLEGLIKETVQYADYARKFLKPNGNVFVEYMKTYGESIGITVRGEEDEGGVFHIGTFYPFLKSSFKDGLMEEEIFINKKVDSDAYTGMCDDNNLGVSLIFYIQNIEHYIQAGEGRQLEKKKKVKLVALSNSGKIILPTQKRIYSHIASKIDSAFKNQLMDEAKNGDMAALDLLSMNDMDNNAQLQERIKREDLFSIVETSFIPYGSESDLYTILANIIGVRQIVNTTTNEKLWGLTVICNDIPFEIVINEKDLIGLPSVGMRFKGVIWMQGEVY